MESHNEADFDRIDLDKLSQRELLILCARDSRETKADVKELRKENEELKLKVNTLETTMEIKSRVNGGLLGFIAGTISGIISALVSAAFTKS